MKLRALLLCEEVRVEDDGSLALRGVRNDRLRVRPPASGPIVIEQLAVLVVVSGLSGFHRVGFRAEIREVDGRSSSWRPLSHEDHVPGSDEHNFIFAYSPMVFSRIGTYEFSFDIQVVHQSATFGHRFSVEAADPTSE